MLTENKTYTGLDSRHSLSIGGMQAKQFQEQTIVQSASDLTPCKICPKFQFSFFFFLSQKDRV